MKRSTIKQKSAKHPAKASAKSTVVRKSSCKKTAKRNKCLTIKNSSPKRGIQHLDTRYGSLIRELSKT